MNNFNRVTVVNIDEAITEILKSVTSKDTSDDLIYNIMTSILENYEEHYRHYHDVEHLIACLNEFQEVEQLVKQPDIVKFALLYHDIVYIPGYSNNEDASVCRAMLDAYKLGIDENSRSRIGLYIGATNHLNLSATEDGKIVKDIDLAILGQDRDKFIDYEHKIRKEYSFLNDKEFKEGRRSFLIKLLEPKYLYNSLYKTQYFRKKYEEKARENIKYSIEVLNAN
jgi:predicted metal-dependent HD superfamily phosphohydrolase